MDQQRKLHILNEKYLSKFHLEVDQCGYNAPYLLPIRLSIIYLLFSVFVFVICPFQWEVERPILFYLLLVTYIFLLWFGYRLGINIRFNKSGDWNEQCTDKLIRIISPLIILNVVLYIINIFRDYGFSSFDFIELVQQMWIGIQNPGLGYEYHLVRIDTLQGSDVVGGYLFTIVNYFWSFFKYPIVILSMIYFKRLKLYAKIFAIIYLTLVIVFYISIGTNIDVLTVFLYFELPIILSTFILWNKRKIEKKHIIKLIASILVGIMIIFGYFTWMMVSRGGINNYEDPSYNVGGVSIDIGQGEAVTEPPVDDSLIESESPLNAESNVDEPIVNESTDIMRSDSSLKFEVPPIFMKFWISFSSYFTQGYYGFAQSLTVPWTPMFGFGNSMFIVDFVTEHVYDIDQFTYQMKLEPLGWDSDIQWHSMYTWIANDVSFYGVIIVMLLIGIAFGAIFKDAISKENPFAMACVFYFILMVLFIPCNNQLAQRPETLFSFILLIICWVLSKYPKSIFMRFFKKD